MIELFRDNLNPSLTPTALLHIPKKAHKKSTHLEPRPNGKSKKEKNNGKGWKKHNKKLNGGTGLVITMILNMSKGERPSLNLGIEKGKRPTGDGGRRIDKNMKRMKERSRKGMRNNNMRRLNGLRRKLTKCFKLVYLYVQHY